MIELVGVAALSALALAPLALWLRRAVSNRAALLVAMSWLAIVCALAILAPAPPVPEEEVTERPAVIERGGYVGSDTCRACHPDQYASWSASYHRTMTQIPSEESIVAPWDGMMVRFEHEYRLEKRGDEYWVRSDDPRWQTDTRFPAGTRPVVLTTGSHHEQFYWVAADQERRMELLPVVYRIAEKRWLPHSAVLLTPPVPHRPDDTRWNTVCIACHATNGVPRIELIDGDALGRMKTEASEFGISCEACHGPGAEHVEANQSPVVRYAKHFGGGNGDPTIVNPARLDSKRSTEVCGSCHSVFLFPGDDMRRFVEEGHGFRPGDVLGDSRWVPRYADRHDPRVAEVGGEGLDGFDHRFWPDGMPSTSGREMTGLLESGCFQKSDMTCLSCHRMHKPSDDPRSDAEWADDQLDVKKLGDEMCLQCHQSFRSDVEAHTHHPAESDGSRCVNCHMPNTSYGLLKLTRSHLIDNPSVQNTLDTNRPNACNLCHLDQPLAWTAKWLGSWYATPQPEITDADQHLVSDAVVRGLSGDAGLRAMIAWHMGWEPALEASGSRWMVPVLAQLLEDPYMAVRHIAARSLRSRPGWTEFPYMYLAPPDQLTEAHQRALARWSELDPSADRRRGTAILVDDEGRLQESRFQRLLRARDDRLVYRQE